MFQEGEIWVNSFTSEDRFLCTEIASILEVGASDGRGDLGALGCCVCACAPAHPTGGGAFF